MSVRDNRRMRKSEIVRGNVKQVGFEMHCNQPPCCLPAPNAWSCLSGLARRM